MLFVTEFLGGEHQKAVVRVSQNASSFGVGLFPVALYPTRQEKEWYIYPATWISTVE